LKLVDPLPLTNEGLFVSVFWKLFFFLNSAGVLRSFPIWVSFVSWDTPQIPMIEFPFSSPTPFVHNYGDLFSSKGSEVLRLRLPSFGSEEETSLNCSGFRLRFCSETPPTGDVSAFSPLFFTFFFSSFYFLLFFSPHVWETFVFPRTF